MATLGFKIGAASGSGATAAAAIGGGLYLGNNTSTIENETNVSEEKASEPSNKENSPEPTKDKDTEKTKQNENLKSKSSWRKSTSKTPKWVPVTKTPLEAPVITTSSYSEQFEKRYSLFLPNTSIDNNDDRLAWWENKFELLDTDRKTNNLDAKFQTVKQAYDEVEINALNQVCKSVYSSSESETKTYSFDYQQSDTPILSEEQRIISDLEKNFWKYCTPLMFKPWNMVESKEASTDSAHVSFYLTAGYILAATKQGINDQFWEIKNKWFLDLFKADKVDPKFKAFAEKREAEVKENSEISLRKVCSKTTKINLANDELTVKEVVQYCAFSEHFYKASN